MPSNARPTPPEATIYTVGVYRLPRITACIRYTVALTELGEWSRESIARWLARQPELSSVRDWEARAGSLVLPWERRSSEEVYLDSL